jgi:hypothetical protein
VALELGLLDLPGAEPLARGEDIGGVGKPEAEWLVTGRWRAADSS